MIDTLIETKTGPKPKDEEVIINLFDYRRPADWLKAAANFGVLRALARKDFLALAGEQAIHKGRELVIDYFHRGSKEGSEITQLRHPQIFSAQNFDLNSIILFGKHSQLSTQLEPPINSELMEQLNQNLNEDDEILEEEGIGAIVELPKTPFKVLVAFSRPLGDTHPKGLIVEELMRDKKINPEVIHQVPIGVRRNKVIRAPGFSLIQVDIFDYFKVIR